VKVDRTRYGPWALIAGGSEGLGASFAEQLASEGFHLVLLGRKADVLEETAARARERGVEVRSLSVDLTAHDALSQIQAITDDVEIGLLVYNAGANSYSHEFIDGDLIRLRSVVDVNVAARMVLCHHFGSLMKARERGGMILVGSMAGYRGTPMSCVYNSAKAFTRIFAEGLWYELKDDGVDVVEFVVGGMKTPAMARRGMKFGPDVAETGRRRP
jgi:short-subunit dehydrogenase